MTRFNKRGFLFADVGEGAKDLIEILFDRTRGHSRGIRAERFRVEFRRQRDLLDRMVEKGIITDFRRDKDQLYRTTGFVVPLLDHAGAKALVVAMDLVCEYLKNRYIEHASSEQVYLSEISDHLSIDEKVLGEAFLLMDDVSTWRQGCSADFPHGDAPYVLTGESNLDAESFSSIVDKRLSFRYDDNGAPINEFPASTYLHSIYDGTSLPVEGAVDRSLLAPRGFEYFPDNLTGLIREVESAIAQEMTILASVGLRTIADVVITKVVGDQGSFKRKLSVMVENGCLSKVQEKNLAASIDMGNASAHRGYSPNSGHVETCMIIVAHLLTQFYELPDKIAVVESDTPKRG